MNFNFEGFVASSRKTLTEKTDTRMQASREKLKKEIIDDLSGSGVYSVCITSDHGTSRDRFGTRKNTLTLSRTTKDYILKTDTLDLINCHESQTGRVIRESVKESLVQWAGFDAEKFIVSWVTDNEAKQVNARNPLYHSQVGLPIQYVGGCVDHLIELKLEAALNRCPEMEISVQASRSLVNYFKDSSLARLRLTEISEEMGMAPLTVTKGTTNRWFYRHTEAKRVLELKPAIQQYQHSDLPAHVSQISMEDWSNLKFYVDCLNNIVLAATVFEGEGYVTGSAVIPFCETLMTDLEELQHTMAHGETHKDFIRELLNQMKIGFPGGFKEERPYNTLTLLDPRFQDLYFDPNQTRVAMEVIENDRVFLTDILNTPSTPTPSPSVSTSAQITSASNKTLDSKVGSLR